MREPSSIIVNSGIMGGLGSSGLPFNATSFHGVPSSFGRVFAAAGGGGGASDCILVKEKALELTPITSTRTATDVMLFTRPWLRWKPFIRNSWMMVKFATQLSL